MNNKEYAFSLHRVGKSYSGNKKVLDNINLSFYYGAKIGILGLNGSGKSTLMKIIAGLEKEYSGEVHRTEGYSLGYLPQEPELNGEKTVKENVMEGLGEVVELLKRFEEINAAFADPELDPDKMQELLDEQAKVQDRIEQLGGWELDHILEVAMDALRLPPGDNSVEHLSGGEKRRVALCKLLLEKPDVLLLDEPTNHLDAETVLWLEQHLQNYEGTVIAITHDRYFLDNIAGWILELDRGQGIPWEGNYSSWLEQKEKRLAQEERKDAKRQKTLERELEWIRMSPKARQSKSKARIKSYEQLLSQDSADKVNDLEIFIPQGPRLGDVVIQAQGVAKSYDEKLLFDDLNFTIQPGSIIGIIGGNGAGKTTLFRMIMDQEKPDAGSITIGDSVVLGYVDQTRDELAADKTVWEEISGGDDLIQLGSKEVNSRAYCARFAFTGSDQQKPVGALSGGERNRVHLAKLLKKESNVLLLDEPTNDLDVNTLRALEEAILNYAGCVLVISHDRWFLDRIATHIISFEGDSNVVMVEGGFQEYEEDKVKRLGPDALTPKSVKYRKLTT